MPIGTSLGKYFESEFDLANDQFNPKEMASTLAQQDVGGGTGADAFNQPLADYKLPLEMDQYIPKRGAQEVSMKLERLNHIRRGLRR
jgi:hypothetical protein